MGSLATVSIPEVEVPLPGGGDSLTVRGLTSEDIATLYRGHAEPLEEVFQRFTKEQRVPDMAEIVQIAVNEFPIFASTAIAIANDEPDLADVAAKLPAVTQVKSLIEIIGLTFESWAEVKKILDIVADKLEEARMEGLWSDTLPIGSKEKNDGSTASEPGSGASEET